MLPLMPEFMFATGIENSYPTVLLKDGRTIRVDEMEKTGHYRRWRDDFALVKELGIPFLRYGPPYYRTHLGPGRYDWSFADDTFRALRDLRIEPIADLCHFGVPDWAGSFQNPDWPAYFAEYAGAFARRYPWVRRYTPVNEIFVGALFSGQYGWWNERLNTDEGFVVALKHLCRANVLAMHAILEAHRGEPPTFIQSESSEYFHAESPACVPRAEFHNEKRFLALDLTYGYPLSATMYEYLTANGMTRAEYHWFLEQELRGNCIMGTDYYPTNEHLIRDDGSTDASGEIFGYYVISRQYYERYKLPLMHTETNTWEPWAVSWLHKAWANMIRLKQDGIPICGFTWYSLTDQLDWDTVLREDNGTLNPMGLVDLERKIRPVGAAYRTLIQQWRDILPTNSIFLRLSY
jgi:beta-glucosidase/6-phospho-beta-glucosidase/beta-galactosidase